MKILLVVAVLSTLLSVTYAVGGESSSSENEPLNENEKVRSHILKNHFIDPTTIHFVDDKNYPKVYLANGVLVDENKVLTTRHFLKKYQLNVEKEELYVYCVKREFKRDIIKVIRVEINMAKNGRLAIAHLERNIVQRLYKIDRCHFHPPPTGTFIGDIAMEVVGWTFKNTDLNGKIHTEEEFYNIIGDICSQKIQQMSFVRTMRIDNRELRNNYVDPQSKIFYGEEGSPVFYPNNKRLFGIVCSNTKNVVNVHDEMGFLIAAGVEK